MSPEPVRVGQKFASGGASGGQENVAKDTIWSGAFRASEPVPFDATGAAATATARAASRMSRKLRRRTCTTRGSLIDRSVYDKDSVSVMPPT